MKYNLYNYHPTIGKIAGAIEPTFDRNPVTGIRDRAAVDRNMVLLLGMPRSGTTWISKLLDSHPETYCLHEPDTVFPCAGLPLLTNVHGDSELEPRVRRWLNDILERQHAKVSGFPPIFPKTYLPPLSRGVLQGTTLLSRVASRVSPQQTSVQPLRLGGGHEKAGLLVWKSIESMGRAKVITDVCPASRVIHLLRHPCGHVNSIMSGTKSGKFLSCIYEDWNLFDKLLLQSRNSTFTPSDIREMSPEERLAVRWGIMNDHCLASVPDNRRLVVRYEAVCEDPEAELTRLLRWCGLNLVDQNRKFILSSTAQDKDSYYGTTKDPRKSAYSWKSALDEGTVSRIMAIVEHFESRIFVPELAGQNAEIGSDAA